MNNTKNIFLLMQKHNISAYQLSKSIGISQATITGWKKGRAKPTADILLKLSAYFHVSIDYLLNNNIFAEQKNDSEYTIKIADEALKEQDERR